MTPPATIAEAQRLIDQIGTNRDLMLEVIVLQNAQLTELLRPVSALAQLALQKDPAK